MTDTQTVALVCEKPHTARLYLEAYARSVPEKPWQTLALYAVTAGGYQSAYRFTFPRGLTISDYPLIRDPVWHNHGNFGQSVWGFDPDTQQVRREHDTVGRVIATADTIVFACDPDLSGYASFDTLLRMETGADRDWRFAAAMEAFDTAPATLNRAACAPLQIVHADNLVLHPAHAHARIRAETEHVAAMIDRARMRRFIEYNFRLNALPLWGQALRDAGVSTDDWMISRWLVQVLYALREAPPMRKAQIARLMSGWRCRDGKRHRFGLGSILLAGQGLDDLFTRGFFVAVPVDESERADPRYPWTHALGMRERDNPRYLLSPRAHAVLARLHPDTEDRDLPKRIAAWEQAGSEARPIVERYIRTLFGKQKRFFKRHFV